MATNYIKINKEPYHHQYIDDYYCRIIILSVNMMDQ